MISFCSQCNTEFTSSDQEVCVNCGTPRNADQTPPVPTLQSRPTVMLKVGPRKSLRKTEKLTEVETVITEAADTLTDSDESTADQNLATPNATVETAATSEEIKTFWQCPQCSHLNAYDAEYCDECGAMYVSPEEQAVKALAKQNEPQSLPPEVLAMLSTHIEDGVKTGWYFKTGSSTNEGVLRQGHADEDSIFVLELRRFYQAKPESFGLYVVADGMGGQAAGEIASRNAIQGIAQIALSELAMPWMSGQTFEPEALEQILRKSVLEGHARVRDWNLKNVKDSGSTLTMACLIDNHAAFANVGDSRTYLFRRGGEIKPPKAQAMIELTDTAPLPSLDNGRRSTDKLKFNGEVRNPQLTRPQEEVEEQMLQAGLHAAEPYQAIRVTRDQSLVQELMESGQLTLEEVYSDPRRNVVLNGLGTQDETVEVDTYSRRLESGDRILLCSDGLWEMVRDPAIAEKVTHLPDPQLCANELILLACKNGGADNVSVVIVAVEQTGNS